MQSKRTLKYQQRTERTVPYRTKLCRTKVTKLFGGDEKFCPTKILSEKVFSGKVVRKLGQIHIFWFCILYSFLLFFSNKTFKNAKISELKNLILNFREKPFDEIIDVKIFGLYCIYEHKKLRWNLSTADNLISFWWSNNSSFSALQLSLGIAWRYAEEHSYETQASCCQKSVRYLLIC